MVRILVPFGRRLSHHVALPKREDELQVKDDNDEEGDEKALERIRDRMIRVAIRFRQVQVGQNQSVRGASG